MAIVKQRAPSAHLLLIGAAPDPGHLRRVQSAIRELGVADVVSYLGLRDDVPAILRASDIGVLSSCSEGLPLALLEYGRAGLAVAATDVGQCGEVLAGGRAGLLVPPSKPQELAEALVRLLADEQQRLALGRIFQVHVESAYGANPIIGQICSLYSAILSGAA
jgi:glycosyltransferase involved in cell wall biosynthesis